MSYIWTSEYPVTRMMGTHSFSLIFFSPTQSIFHICFFTHSWMGTQPFFHSLMNEYSPNFQGTQIFLQVFVITLSWMSECLVTHMKSVTASHVTQFKSHIWTNEGMSWCHAYEAWVLLFAFNESYHTCEWVNALSHTWMNECFSCHSIYLTNIDGKVYVFMSHIWVRGCFSSLRMINVTCMNKEASEIVFPFFLFFSSFDFVSP